MLLIVFKWKEKTNGKLNIQNKVLLEIYMKLQKMKKKGTRIDHRSCLYPFRLYMPGEKRNSWRQKEGTKARLRKKP